MQNISIFFIIEMIGTVAFASSGAMVAIKKELDLLGVVVLGVTTAVGGGMLRDIILGNVPPALFMNPVYVIAGFLTVLVLFTVVRLNQMILESRSIEMYERGRGRIAGHYGGADALYSSEAFLCLRFDYRGYCVHLPAGVCRGRLRGGGQRLPGCGDPAAGHAVLLESAEGDEEEKRSGVRGGFLGGTLRRAAGVFPGGTHWRLSRPSRAPYKSGMKMIAPQ